MKLLSWAARIFLAVWVFLIPSTLAYHFNRESGLVNGIIVDYRIPNISASGVALGGLIICLVLLVARGQVTPRFFHSLGQWGIGALLAAFIFQTALGLYQFRSQSSLTGYLPVGEVDLSAPQIAKGAFGGRIYKLPYGTTSHPNVLAGFLVLSLLLLVLQPFVKIERGYLALLFLFTALICFLTQSLVATSALLAAGFFWQLNRMKLQRLSRTLILLLPLFSFLAFALPQAPQSPNPSIARRAQLQQIAVKMITTHPLTGVGWNNFTLKEEQYGFIPGPIRFLQPVHNIFLLLIAELGILGFLSFVLIRRLTHTVELRWLPVIGALVWIGSLDHYLITLSTGRMLILFVLAAIYLCSRHEPRAVII